jgi:hypothetical protein
VSATSATLPQYVRTRFESDREWFTTHRNEVFRIREPQPDEMKPDRGAPVVFCIAVRDPGTGAVVRVVRMLRHRLIPNLRAVGGRS